MSAFDRFHQELEIHTKAIEKNSFNVCCYSPVVATEKDFRNYSPKLTEVFDGFSNEDIWMVLQFLQFIVKWDFCESLPNLSF